MRNILNKIYNSNFLTQKESYQLFTLIISGKINEIQLSSILTAIQMRGESIEEITGAIDAFLKKMKFFPKPNYFFSDIVGTGGDIKNTINVSTASAFVASSCGFKIIKHCNKGVSSKSGSSNLLKKLKINLHASIEKSLKTLEKLNICFLFAPEYHSGFKYVASVRNVLKIKTIFNVLGPFLNPSNPPFTLIGVYKKELIDPFINILKKLNYQRAIVVHGDNTDEVTLQGITYVSELVNKKIYSYELKPHDFGIKKHPQIKYLESTLEENFHIIRKTMQGKGNRLHEELIAVNVAMLLKNFGCEDIKENTEMALDKIRSGDVYQHIMNVSAMLKEE